MHLNMLFIALFKHFFHHRGHSGLYISLKIKFRLVWMFCAHVEKQWGKYCNRQNLFNMTKSLDGVQKCPLNTWLLE